MLVAEEREYSIENYPYRQEEQYERNVRKSKQHRKTKPKAKGRVKPILVLMLVFCMASLVIVRYVNIMENQQQIALLQQQLDKQRAIQENLKVSLAEAKELNRIEKVAKNDLKMNYPNKGQVLVVQLPENKDNIEQKVTANASAVQLSLKSLFDKIIRFID